MIIKLQMYFQIHVEVTRKGKSQQTHAKQIQKQNKSRTQNVNNSNKKVRRKAGRLSPGFIRVSS